LVRTSVHQDNDNQFLRHIAFPPGGKKALAKLDHYPPAQLRGDLDEKPVADSQPNSSALSQCGRVLPCAAWRRKRRAVLVGFLEDGMMHLC
jgi:hypothetical protein